MSLIIKFRTKLSSLFQSSFLTNILIVASISLVINELSSLLSNEMMKQQIWTKRDSQWSIIYEGGT